MNLSIQIKYISIAKNDVSYIHCIQKYFTKTQTCIRISISQKLRVRFFDFATSTALRSPALHFVELIWCLAITEPVPWNQPVVWVTAFLVGILYLPCFSLKVLAVSEAFSLNWRKKANNYYPFKNREPGTQFAIVQWTIINILQTYFSWYQTTTKR